MLWRVLSDMQLKQYLQSCISAIFIGALSVVVLAATMMLAAVATDIHARWREKDSTLMHLRRQA